MGFQIARQLIAEHRNVVLIERDSERVKVASNQLDCMVVSGEANNREVLRNAGIEDAEFFISVTESDELNMIACAMVESEFNVPNKIARVRNIDYSDSRIADRSFLGIDYVVNPEIEAAKAILRSVEQGATSDIMYFENSSFQMRTISITESSPIVGQSVQEIKSRIDREFIIAVVVRENNYIIPSGTTVINKGDTLYLIATQEDLEQIFNWAGKRRTEIKRVLIIGGGRIGSYVASNLLGKQGKERKSMLGKLFAPLLQPRFKRSITIFEKDYHKAQNLAEQFPEVSIVHGDISEEGLLEDGNYSDYDLFIAATDNQELNLVTSLYAKSLGIQRSVALVTNKNFLHMASSLMVDTTISLNNSMVNTILKFIRRGNIRNVHTISGGKLEIIEVSCETDCPFVGRRIRDLKLPPNTLILFISQAENNQIPFGDYLIEYGDHIVFIAHQDSIKKLDRLLESR